MKGGSPTDKAIVKLEKTEFQQKDVVHLGNETNSSLVHSEKYFQNDVFRKFWVALSDDAMKIQTDLIYPASQTLINKYT